MKPCAIGIVENPSLQIAAAVYDFERTVYETGTAIWHAGASFRPSRLNREMDTFLVTLSQHSDLRDALVQFLAALPNAQHLGAVGQLLANAFPSKNPNLHPLLNLGIGATHSPFVPNSIVGAGAKLAAFLSASRFVVGKDARSAMPQFMRMRAHGEGIIGDFLGEEVTSPPEAAAYLQKYLDLVDHIIAEYKHPLHGQLIRLKPLIRPFSQPHQMDAQISLKFSCLCANWADKSAQTKEDVKTAMRVLLRKVRGAQREHVINIGVTVDLEHFEYSEITYEIFMELMMEDKFRDMQNAGIVVQAYLRNSKQILEELASWSRARGGSIQPRLVKGAYHDYEVQRAARLRIPSPVYEQKWQSDVNYERLIDVVMNHAGSLRGSFGTHNIRSLSYAIARAQWSHVPIELQILFAMAQRIEYGLIQEGYPLAVYGPLGEKLPTMAYCSRRLREIADPNSCLIQYLIGDDDAIRALIQNPITGHEREWADILRTEAA